MTLTSQPPPTTILPAPGGGPRELHLTCTNGPLPEENDVQRIHALVAALTDGSRRPLWALPRPGVLLIQHDAPLAQAPAGAAASVDYAARLGVLRVGDAVRWSLIGNPVRAAHPGTAPDGTPRGRGRITPLPAAQRAAWARRHLADALDIRDLDDAALPRARGRRAGAAVQIVRHLFTGSARVTDPVALHVLVASGVGRGKTYGCGLLLITEEVAG
jgi:hypothetical protein